MGAIVGRGFQVILTCADGIKDEEEVSFWVSGGESGKRIKINNKIITGTCHLAVLFSTDERFG